MSNFVGFDKFQIRELEKGVEKGIDVTVYAKPEFSTERMWCIRNLMERGKDFSEFLDPNVLDEDALLKRYKEIKAHN